VEIENKNYSTYNWSINETIKKGLAQNLQLFPGHPLATELQKITLKIKIYAYKMKNYK
jgi:hypothetical protein